MTSLLQTSSTSMEAVLHVRVSDPKYADYGDSLEMQESLGREWADEYGYKIIKVFAEPYTGREFHRPILENIFAYLKAHPQINTYIIPRIDRFTRGGSEYYHGFKNRLSGMGVELRDVQGKIQPPTNLLKHTGFEYEWSVVSPSRKGETVEAEDARDYVVQFLTKTITKQIHLVNQGYTVRPAPLGYKNQKIKNPDGKKRMISVPHPVEGKWFTTMFDLCAEGILSDEEICERVNALGFRTRLKEKHERLSRKVMGMIGGKQLNPKMLRRLVSNPRYCNVILEKWNSGKAVFAHGEALTTIETFNRANNGKVTITTDIEGNPVVGYDRLPYKSNINNPAFPYRFVVRCPKCKQNFRGSFSRGRHGDRYPGYHCSHGHSYYRVPQKELHQVVEGYFQKLSFTQQARKVFKAVVMETWEKKQQEKQSLAKETVNTNTDITAEQKRVVDQMIHTESDVVKKLLEEKVNELEQQKAIASNQSTQPTISKNALNQYLETINEIMNSPSKFLVEPSNQQFIRRVWSITFTKYPTYEELKDGTPELSLAFRLCGDSEMSKIKMVAPVWQNWNTFVKGISGIQPM